MIIDLPPGINSKTETIIMGDLSHEDLGCISKEIISGVLFYSRITCGVYDSNS